MVNINGISKGRVLAELYNASRPLGLGFLHYVPTPMTECQPFIILNKIKS